MRTIDLLTELRRLGVELSVEGETLRWSAPTGALSPDLLDDLRDHKAEVVALVRAADGNAAPVIELAPRDGRPLPLSYSQERMWFLSHLDTDGNPYVETEAYRIRGAVDAAALERAVTEIVRRHENLRTRFVEVDGTPKQVVDPAGRVAIAVVDASGVAEHDRAAHVTEAARAERRRPFDLATGPLLQVTLLRFADADHALLVTMHHILGDAWSRHVFVRELAILYGAFARGAASPLPEPAIQYADFAAWQRRWLTGEVLAGHLEYWKRALADVPTLQVPTDRPPTTASPPPSSEQVFRIDRDLTEQLRVLGRAESATLFTVLVAAFAALLRGYTGQTDIALGTEVANRTRRETEKLIGLLVNQLVLRIDVGGDPSFRELVRRARAVTLDAYAHQDLPFEKLVEELQPERNVGRQPLFQVGLTLENAAPALPSLPGLEIERTKLAYGALYDLYLFLTEHDGVEGPLVYNPALFDDARITRMLESFGTLLRAAAADPDRPVSRLELLGPAERRDVLYAWNDTVTPLPDDDPVHRLLERRARRTPDRTAVVYGASHLTYRALDEAANRLAHRLRAHGATRESLVGICLEPSLERVVGALAILKAGAAIVFLDPTYPPDRLELMLRESRLAALLTTEQLAAQLPETGVARICVDRDAAELAREPADDPGIEVLPDHLLYAIFTSGSTGVPKRIGFTHRAFRNLLAWQEAEPDLGGPGRTLQFSTFGFCVSFQEIFSTLAAGGTLVLAPGEVRVEPDLLLGLLRAESVERLYLPFAALKLLAASATQSGALPSRLRAVVTAGEQLHVTDDVRALFGRLGASLHNQYGASETHVVTSHVLSGPPAGWPTIPPIGRPNWNNRIYVLDGRLEPVPAGVPGELYVAGAAPPRGYLDDPELTAAKLVPDPYGPTPGARMYRTGDLAMWLFDGSLKHLGRVDHQIKVRGFRVELGEIEAVLRRHPEVRDVAVTAVGEDSAARRLVAYFVAADGLSDVGELWSHVERELPQHMVPSALVPLESLPLNANGKLDYERLPAPGHAHRRSEAAFVAPRTELERDLAEVVSEVLGVGELGIHDDFFELGGHSLLATQAILRMRERLGVQLPLRAIFDGPTVAELSVRIVEAQLDAADAERVSRAMSDTDVLAAPRLAVRARGSEWSYDVIVVGARCAGAPTAMLLAREGHRVLLVDRARFPKDTISTHFVWQPGVAQLDRWGLLDRLVATGLPAIFDVTTDYGDFPLTGTPPPVDGVAAAYAPLRTVLDPLLVDAAVEAGAELREACVVDELLFDDGAVVGVAGRAGGTRFAERADVVVGADGRSSLVARAVGAAEYDVRPPLACYYYGYWSGVDADGFAMYQRGRRLLVTFPTNDGLTVVLAGWPSEEFERVRADAERSFAAAVALVPELDEALRSASRFGRLRGTAPLPNFFRRPFGRGWALVGDAGHHKDPHSARGISDAFRDAELLAGALHAGLSGIEALDDALAAYEARRNEVALPLYELNCQAAGLEPPSARELARRAELRGDQPEIDRLLGVMAGSVSLDEIGAPTRVA